MSAFAWKLVSSPLVRKPVTRPHAWKVVSSPLGDLRLVATEDALAGVYFPSHHPPPPEWAASTAGPGASLVLEQAAAELAEYFAGWRRTFSTPLSAHGSHFQRAVWNALAGIPFGERRSYAELARLAGRPHAARAAGAANARNPLSIFVPCHRVVGADGALTGYAGGLDAKRWLLEHERAGPYREPALPIS